MNQIKAHDTDIWAQRFIDLGNPPHWEIREFPNGGSQTDIQQCSFCGSVHPMQLITLLETGCSLRILSWNYGWPDRLEVEGVANVKAGQEIQITSPGGNSIVGIAPDTVPHKFYTSHLLDLEVSQFDKLCRLIADHTGIEFNLAPQGGLVYNHVRS